ncbi:MAG TPA: hypothetical protein VEB86_06725 [Chryseosolibacter sp.]|nr:hypothetical protein [Chryseosolibacter sp.]
MKCILVLALPIVLAWPAAASDPKVDSLKKLGRAALIDLAIRQMNDPQFDASQYDRVTVKANENSLIVEFGLSVTLKTNRSCFYNGIMVALAGSGSGKSIEGNCKEPVYYRETRRIQKKVAFVFAAINGSEVVGGLRNDRLPVGTSMEVTQRGRWFHVRTDSWSTMSRFKINRLSGRVTRAMHKHYARTTAENDEFEIIQ